jgi:CheY-like chemotaxis protein
VEDSADDVFLLKRALKAAHVLNPVHVITDGQQAIDYLCGKDPYGEREKFPLPCLVLLDLKMPRVSGLEVLNWVKDQPSFKALPVLVLTSSAEPGDIEKAYQLGANSYFVKPSSSEKLAEVVEFIAKYWLQYNQTPPSFRSSRATALSLSPERLPVRSLPSAATALK